MPILRLTTAIENVESDDEEKVLALLDHLAPTLASWRQGEHFRIEQITLAGQVDPLRQKIQAAADEVARLKSNAAILAQQAKKQKALALLVYGASVALALGLFFSPLGPTVAGGLLLLGLGLGFWQQKKAAQIAAQVETARQECVSVEAGLGGLHNQLFGVEERMRTISAELDTRADGFPEVVLARVGFPVTSEEIAGTNVMVDLSACHPSVRLQAIDFSQISAEMVAIGNKVQAMPSMPPLLVPGDKPIEDPMTQLYGEESELQDLVSEFTATLGKLREVSMEVPLVPTNSVLVQRLRAGDLGQASSSVDLQVRISQEPEVLDRFIKAVNSGDSSGADVPNLVKEVYDALDSTCNRFTHARLSSINTIHEGLSQVLNRANWVSQKFLCPRTVQAPKYVQDILGVQINEAHQMQLHDLLDRLQGDEEIRKRLAKKPELLEQLENGYYAMQDLTPASVNTQDMALKPSGHPRHMLQQLEESIKQFRLTLTQVITGAARPVLNITPQAQLFYDPELEEWSSDFTPYVYTTPQVCQYGMTTKVMHDLMLPLWEHLWTEKADFRKFELFRTNEAMINMSEKESEKIIEVGNQFRGDMRSNRENLYLIESELNSKYDEIISFRDGMQRLDLISERVMHQLSDDKLRELVVDESPLEVGSRFETNLALMPRMQSDLRGTVADPIDMLRKPSLLIESMKQEGTRLLAQ